MEREEIYKITNSGKVIPVGELVRCKDCEKRNQHKECMEGYGYHSDDWFCADGVKKDE